MSNKFKDWIEAPPLDSEVGKLIDIKLNIHSEILTGELIIEEWRFSGEDEYPIYAVELTSGETVSFVEYDLWRISPNQKL